jgi:hypothetical protein
VCFFSNRILCNTSLPSCLALSSFPTDLFVLFLAQFFFSGVYLALGFLCFVPQISHVFLSIIVMCGLFLLCFKGLFKVLKVFFH